MVVEPRPIDISEMPELLRLAEEVQSTGEPRLLRRGGEDMAILMPARRSRRRTSRPKLFTKDDSLWNLLGIGRSDVTDVSENKYKYPAEAYMPRTDEKE